MQKLGHKESQVIYWGLQELLDHEAREQAGERSKSQVTEKNFVSCCWAWTSTCKARKSHQTVFNDGLTWPAFHLRASIWMVEKMMKWRLGVPNATAQTGGEKAWSRTTASRNGEVGEVWDTQHWRRFFLKWLKGSKVGDEIGFEESQWGVGVLTECLSYVQKPCSLIGSPLNPGWTSIVDSGIETQ